MRVKENSIFFEVGYFLLFISLFLGDIGLDLDFISSILRYTAYICLIVQLFSKRWGRNRVIGCGIAFGISLAFWMITKDLYWSVIILMIFCSESIEKRKLLKKSFLYIVISIFFVLLLYLIGILPDIISTRNGVEQITELNGRHSLGFIHSNVLPLLILYLEIYYIWIMKEKSKSKVLLFLIVQIILFSICDSRNAVILSVIITFLTIFEKYFNHNINIQILKSVDYIIVLLLSIFSFVSMYGLQFGGIWDKIDSVFSGRFRLGVLKIRTVGIHFITFLSNKDYFKDGIVLDNGYIYLALRYGVGILIFLGIVNYLLVKDNEKNYFVLVCILIVFIANLIDNDLADYCFLPFLLIAFEKKNNDNLKWKEKVRWNL